ncbi:aldehyde dehydrogenase [uncultured Imperialibacter sp.]|uniref:aldehyde dehydrogenase n=1 Tax=uncultured Imperialibacter sp. TaxID=1672639 RepID=UPI0030D7EC1C
MKKFANYIDGKLVPSKSKDYLDNYNPATGEVYSLLPDSCQEDVEEAVAAAKGAFPKWSGLSPEDRSQYLIKIAEAVEQSQAELALAETIDTGKPLWLSNAMDIPRAAANFRFFGHAITQFASESHLVDSVALNYTRRGPLGVVGCISPWNLPLYLFTWKVAPALAAGNTVVAKPSELTPHTAFLLSEICIKAGLPPGALNIVHGTGSKVGQSIVQHDEVKAVSFTGGTATGRKVALTAAETFKRTSLELGGKNPTIIFEDCDFDLAVESAVRSSFTNQGEICLCGSRIYVEEGIYEQFLSEFVKQVRALKVGDPLDGDVKVGALVSQQHQQKVLQYLELAKQEGGHILCGGGSEVVAGRCERGYFVQPTVIAGLPNSCRTNQEEIFGPVVSVQPFKGADQAVSLGNESSYGLAANIWTSDLKKAHNVSHKLHFGIVWVNTWLLRDLRTPFGGMKNSGLGREGGFESLRFFTEAQNICIKL